MQVMDILKVYAIKEGILLEDEVYYCFQSLGISTIALENFMVEMKIRIK